MRQQPPHHLRRELPRVLLDHVRRQPDGAVDQRERLRVRVPRADVIELQVVQADAALAIPLRQRPVRQPPADAPGLGFVAHSRESREPAAAAGMSSSRTASLPYRCCIFGARAFTLTSMARKKLCCPGGSCSSMAARSALRRSSAVSAHSAGVAPRSIAPTVDNASGKPPHSRKDRPRPRAAVRRPPGPPTAPAVRALAAASSRSTRVLPRAAEPGDRGVARGEQKAGARRLGKEGVEVAPCSRCRRSR